MRFAWRFVALSLGALVFVAPARAADVLNIYSARHYDSDELLYDGFEKATGIPVNVIEGDGPELLARMKAEGKNSPADVFLTVDAGNLWLAEKREAVPARAVENSRRAHSSVAEESQESLVRILDPRAADFRQRQESRSETGADL
jgi:ABC-type thiamine transport system substrate-binding protein